MDNSFDQSVLQSGDVLLYYTPDIVDFIIAEKTGHRVGHVERYATSGLSMASRNGVGVNIYPLRLDGLVSIRRPIGQFNFEKGYDWFNNGVDENGIKIKGQGYDFDGLVSFTSFVDRGHAGQMFCSEFSVNFDRACGYASFNPAQGAWSISPAAILLSGAYETVWYLNDYYK